jgi:hypothetical protein
MEMKAWSYSQRGISFLGFIGIASALIFVVILGMKLVPPYVHDAQIAQIFKTMANDPAMQTGSIKDIKDSYNKRANISYITDITAEDIDINKDGGTLRLSANYSVKIPVGGNISLVIEFNPSSS